MIGREKNKDAVQTEKPSLQGIFRRRISLWNKPNLVSFAVILGVVMVGTALYFLIMHFIFPRIEILESHIATIILDSFMATVVAFFVIRKISRLSEDKRLEQQRADEAENIAQIYARSLIEASLDPLVTISADGRIRDVNAAAELATGYSRDELVGTDFSLYFTNPHRARYVYEQVLEQGSIRDFELVLRHESGHLTPVLYNASVYLDKEKRVQGVFAAARDMTQYREAQRKIEHQHEQLRDLAYRLGEVEESERRELARELHDKVGQNLTALGISINILKAQLPPDTQGHIYSRIGDCLNLVSETSARIRDVMVELRPSVLDDYGLLPALRWYGAQFSVRTGIEVQVDGDEHMERLVVSRENAFFRIAQEALTNVAKHADASRVAIHLDAVNGCCRMTISDNGKGFSNDKSSTKNDVGSWGLRAMQERALRTGGRFQVESDPGMGTTVTVEVDR